MDQKTKKDLNLSKIDKGQIMAFINYVKVDEVKNNGETLVVSSLSKTPHQIKIEGKDLIVHAESADIFEETVSVSKTEAAEILVNSYNRPFTVEFVKQDGTPRVLRGKLIHPEPLLGRSMVEDLDLPSTEENKVRLVDHRTINYIIVNGVKYEVK